MELIIALFGIIYLSGKYFGEKSKLNEFDRNKERRMTKSEELRKKYSCPHAEATKLMCLILQGTHYEEICDFLSEDFEYALGKNWKLKLNLPNKYPVSEEKEGFGLPSRHSTWAYHLILAKRGKISDDVFPWGYPLGGEACNEMCVKFAERIEKHLVDNGVEGVRLALALDTCLGRRRLPSELGGGAIKIESIEVHPTYRLW